METLMVVLVLEHSVFLSVVYVHALPLELCSSCRWLCPPDTCKFLHDRSDYKSGWQLDQEWEQQLYGSEGGLLWMG